MPLLHCKKSGTQRETVGGVCHPLGQAPHFVAKRAERSTRRQAAFVISSGKCRFCVDKGARIFYYKDMDSLFDTNNYETDMHPEFSQVYGNELMLYDYMAGAGNSVIKDEDGKSWLKIDNASSTVELTVDVKK